MTEGAKLQLGAQMAVLVVSNSSAGAAPVSELCRSHIPASEARTEHWYAAYTCSRYEKCVARQLEERRVECFLPLYRSWRRWKDRRKQLDLALFSGYVFVRIALPERLRVLEVPGVVRLVSVNGQPVPLPEQDIEALRNALEQRIYAEPHPYLRIGRKVRIAHGPWPEPRASWCARKTSFAW